MAVRGACTHTERIPLIRRFPLILSPSGRVASPDGPADARRGYRVPAIQRMPSRASGRLTPCPPSHSRSVAA